MMDRLTKRDKIFGNTLKCKIKVSGDVNFYNKAVDKLAAYESAEEQGRLIILPFWGNVFICSNGQIQEMKMTHYSGNETGVYKMQCECAEQDEECNEYCHNENEKACAYNFRIAEIGKTVFLTREAAESALAECEKGETEK